MHRCGCCVLGNMNLERRHQSRGRYGTLSVPTWALWGAVSGQSVLRRVRRGFVLDGNFHDCSSDCDFRREPPN